MVDSSPTRQKDVTDILEDGLFGNENERFRLLERIGSGGQGNVYRCERIVNKTEYGAKCIDLRGCSSGSGIHAKARQKLTYLRREIRIMTELHHTRLVNLHCNFEHYIAPSSPLPAFSFLVMDFCKGGDLYERLAKESKEAIAEGSPFLGIGGCETGSKYIARQIVEGLGYMHGNNIWHRDLKLENVFIYDSFPCSDAVLYGSSEPMPKEFHIIKIGDFGYSRETRGTGTDMIMQRTFSTVGTPDYVAPEVLTTVYDNSADFWSLGVITFLLLCGHQPFHIQPLDLRQVDRHKAIVSQLPTTAAFVDKSDDAKSFMQGLLCVDANLRFGHDACQDHAWLKSLPPNEELEARETPSPRRPLSPWQAKAAEKKGVIKHMTGRVGNAVDFLRLDRDDGSILTYGGTGGTNSGKTTLQQGELIFGAVQEARHDYLGNALVFFTSAGRAITFYGAEAKRRKFFVAPSDCQIVGLQFEDHKLQGIHIADVVNEESSVVKIGGRFGYAVDAVRLHLKNGAIRSYGGSGGREQEPCNLLPHEYIVAVEQGRRDAYLGNSMIFYTSIGNVYKILGMEQAPSYRFAVATDEQICGLIFEGSILTAVDICPASGDLEASRRRTGSKSLL